MPKRRPSAEPSHALRAWAVAQLPWALMAAAVLVALGVRTPAALVGAGLLAAAGGLMLWQRMRRARVAEDEVASRLQEERETRSMENIRPLQWGDGLRSGHPLIDQQHEQLLSIINRIVHNGHRTHDRALMQSLLDLAVKKLREHFETEDALLRRIRFPEAEQHLAQHHWLMQTAETLAERYRSGEALIGEVLDFFVDDLMQRHMMRDDAAFALRPAVAA